MENNLLFVIVEKWIRAAVVCVPCVFADSLAPAIYLLGSSIQIAEHNLSLIHI